MPAAISLTRLDYTAAEFRREAKRSDDADAARRMLALALVLEGRSRRRGPAAWICRFFVTGCTVTMRKVCRAFEIEPPGGKPRLSPGKERELAELVRKGPNLAEHGVVRWRRIDVSHVIEQRYGVKLAERSVDDLLRRLAFPTNIDAATLSQIGHRDPGGA
jgi:transposase